jgi:hypothetical protein
MFSQVTTFLCGPFFYPVYFASFLHAFDFFANFTAPESIRSEPRSPFLPSTINAMSQPTGDHKEKK